MAPPTYSNRAFQPAHKSVGGVLAELFAATPLAILIAAIKAAPPATMR